MNNEMFVSLFILFIVVLREFPFQEILPDQVFSVLLGLFIEARYGQ
jgi:hypothetical protein